MKKIIPIILCLLLLCGCQGGTDFEETVSVPDYAETYLEYENTAEYEFYLGGESSILKCGDSLGEFKLDKLQTRSENEQITGIRATFSCDITVSGTFTHLQNKIYGELIRYYPNGTQFPQPLGTAAKNDWLVVLESGEPFMVLGFDGETPAETTATVRIVSYSINTSPNSTVRYIEIEKAE